MPCGASGATGASAPLDRERDVHSGLARDPREGLGDVLPRGALGGNLNVLPRGLVWVVKHPTREEAEVLKRDERDMPITEGKSPHRSSVLGLKRYKELRSSQYKPLGL